MGRAPLISDPPCWRHLGETQSTVRSTWSGRKSIAPPRVRIEAERQEGQERRSARGGGVCQLLREDGKNGYRPPGAIVYCGARI